MMLLETFLSQALSNVSVKESCVENILAGSFSTRTRLARRVSSRVKHPVGPADSFFLVALDASRDSASVSNGSRRWAHPYGMRQEFGMRLS